MSDAYDETYVKSLHLIAHVNMMMMTSPYHLFQSFFASNSGFFSACLNKVISFPILEFLIGVKYLLKKISQSISYNNRMFLYRT